MSGEFRNHIPSLVQNEILLKNWTLPRVPTCKADYQECQNKRRAEH
jgi:hypothetical protein